MNLPEPAATARDDWRSLSACLTEDPELFFPLSVSGPGLVQLAAAKAVCLPCQVRAECLGFALSSGQEFGVWGGTSEEERKAIRRAEHVLAPVTGAPIPVARLAPRRWLRHRARQAGRSAGAGRAPHGIEIAQGLGIGACQAALAVGQIPLLAEGLDQGL